MGYAKTVSSQGLELCSNYTSELLMTTVGATNVVTFEIKIPAFDGNLTNAFLKFKINRLKNTNAGVNHFDRFTVEVSNDNVTFHSCMDIANPLMQINATTQEYGEFTILSDTNIASYVPNGGTLYCKITDTTVSHADTLYIDSCYFLLNLFFR